MSPRNWRGRALDLARGRAPWAVARPRRPTASSVLVAMPNTIAPAVRLARLGEEAEQPGGAPEADEQHAGRVGIERARRGRRAAARRRRAASPRRRATSSRPACRRRRGRHASVTSERGPDGRDDVGDRARRLEARRRTGARRRRARRRSARTSTSPSERRLTRTERFASSFSTQVTSASVVRRRMSMRPSISSSVTSWRSSMSWVTAVHTKRCSTSSSAFASASREQLQVGEAVLLEQLPRQPRDRDVELDELACEVEHARRRGVVLEAAGVAHERGVERDRGGVVERQPELVHEPADEHAARGGVGIDHVDGAVARVRHVVVEHDQLTRAPRPTARARRGGRASRSRR